MLTNEELADLEPSAEKRGFVGVGTLMQLIAQAREANALREEVARLRRNSYPHMCQNDHVRVGHADNSEPEELSCPVCRERNENATLRAKAQIADEIMTWCAKEHNVTLDSAYWRERWSALQPAPSASRDSEVRT